MSITPSETPKPKEPKKKTLTAEEIVALFASGAGGFTVPGTGSTDDMNLVAGFRKDGKPYIISVKDFAQVYSAALFDSNDDLHEKAMQSFQAFRNSGVFGSRNVTAESVYSGFRKIAISAANVYRENKGEKVDPFVNYSRTLQVLSKFQQTSDEAQLNVTGYTDAEASTMAFNAFKDTFGRAPSEDELRRYKSSLTAAAQAAPTVVTSEMVGGKQRITRKGGFDAKAWSAGYMSALLPKEKNKADLSGGAGVIQDTIKAVADAYGVKLDSVTVLNKVRDYLDRGSSASEVQTDMLGQVQGLAKAKYGEGMAAAIDAGSSVKQVVSPFMSKYAQLMEVNPDSLSVGDIADKVVSKEPNGQSRLLTENEFENNVRQTSAWSKTLNAKNEAYDLGNTVLRMFGLVK